MPHSATEFDPLDIPVTGTSLIEASAGTGKTYGIAALFARLVLLEQLPVDRILVVTFTKAATAELKTRLRARLDEALRRLRGDTLPSGPDRFMRGLLEKAAEKEPDREKLVLRLKAALSQFDNAAIYTIHGFCRRLLGDYAFLCQVPFDVELNNGENRLLHTYAQDFWRQSVAHDPVRAKLAFQGGLTPEGLLGEFKSYMARPALTFRRPADSLEQVYAQAQELWGKLQQGLEELTGLFWQVHPNLNGQRFQQKTYEKKFAQLSELLQQDDIPAAWLTENLKNSKGQNVFSQEYLADPSSFKKGKTISEDERGRLCLLGDVYTAAVKLTQAEDDARIALQLDFFEYVRLTSYAQKHCRRERTPDDLLLDTYFALTGGAHKEQLAAAVARNWQVALIDEFQDTDPLQYEIFRSTFIKHGNPLFLVGDPKQAIYSFRGADIHTYLQAAQDAQAHYTLSENHRSRDTLINGISRLFKSKEKPFVLADIGYPAVRAAEKNRPCLEPGQPALRVRWLHGPDDRGGNKTSLRHRAAEYCADEIAGLLNRAANGGLKYGGRPLRPNDIAVLVPNHDQGKDIRRSLFKRGISSVSVQRESVFGTEEAEALAALLDFWLEPRHTESLRFVLAGVLFRQNAAQLYSLNQDEALLSSHIAAAENALDIWQRQGIYTALCRFAADYGVEGRLLAARDDRSLTNFWQLAELLAAEDEAGHTPSALHQWLLAKMRDGNIADDNILRLESDEELVKIVTIHSSKGLQYPIVFCPFSWDTSEGGGASWHILHRKNGSELLEKSQLDEADQEQLDDEDLGERLRLLYVALTRAQEQLVIYAAHCRSTPRNTFAYLLAGGRDGSRKTVWQSYSETPPEERAKKLYEDWRAWVQAAPAGSGIAWEEGAPPGAAAQTRRRTDTPCIAEEYPPRRFRFIRHTSFTGLTRNLGHSAAGGSEEAYADEAETEPGPAGEAGNLDIFHFPRGTAAGVCLHGILEKYRFNLPAAGQEDGIADTLKHYGFGPEWLPAVCGMAEQTARTPLVGGETLARIPSGSRLAEMGFVMHFDHLAIGRLRQYFADFGPGGECLNAAARLDFGILSGFLSGFIDLTCLLPDGGICLVDYKSNHLGGDCGAYGENAMNLAVAEHHYYLQAWIYALAAARHFRSCQYPVRNIHIRYLFLRGLNDQNRNGVWEWDIDVRSLADWL
ncbi:MAG: exodeoxyribonuclease V subunit beta [Neisseria sp.]|nr:exodeoxyribonuclease V subunit beta [Neisseria sp.]